MKIASIVIIALLLFSCKSHTDRDSNEFSTSKDYALKEINGISVEVFDSLNIDPNRYTANNRIYRDGMEFTYRFEHMNVDGKPYVFQIGKKSKDGEVQWSFIPLDSGAENIVEKVKISVKYGLEPMVKYIPDYNQTLLKYNYLTKNGLDVENSSLSGAIENEKNVWIHPPRDLYFKILELNPFPFIKQPYKLGNKWQWSLEIGNDWGDERWKTWEGTIENHISYEIIGKEQVATKAGNYDCFVIEANAKSSLGNTSLKAYFNEIVGFVKLNYTNIDGSKTNLELVSLEEIKK